MLFYSAALPLSAQTLTYVAGVIRRQRKKIGSCWRKLNPGRQALLVLAYLRKGETFADLVAGFGVGTAIALAADQIDDLLVYLECPAGPSGWRRRMAGARRSGTPYRSA